VLRTLGLDEQATPGRWLALDVYTHIEKVERSISLFAEVEACPDSAGLFFQEHYRGKTPHTVSFNVYVCILVFRLSSYIGLELAGLRRAVERL
jgi:hypothetical protein